MTDPTNANEHEDLPEQAYKPAYEPATNVPTIVLVLGALTLAVHIFVQFLSPKLLSIGYLMFAFIPGAYTLGVEHLPYPLARYWSPLTYFFLHADWVHLLVNLTMFAAFGSATARRFGATRFIVFMALATLASALAHIVTNWGSLVPVIGASGGVSACMGAAVRFGFSPNQRMAGYQQPALSLVESLTNGRTMPFVIIWFGINWLFGSGIVDLTGEDASIAWEAHIGGFLFGLLLFSLFDRTGRRASY